MATKFEEMDSEMAEISRSLEEEGVKQHDAVRKGVELPALEDIIHSRWDPAKNEDVKSMSIRIGGRQGG